MKTACAHLSPRCDSGATRPVSAGPPDMITKEKHYTKCETPNGPRSVEDKRHAPKPTVVTPVAAPVEMANAKVHPTNAECVKNDSENKPPVPEVPKTPEEKLTPRDTNGDDTASIVGGQKIGTVIPNRIFVGGFAPKTIDEDLWKFFSAIANITAAKIIYDKSGVSKCYGFVTFANPKEARHIVKQSGGAMISPMGRLRISQAVRKMMPHYQPGPIDYAQIPVSAPMSVQPDGYYMNPSCPPKPSVCLAYPVQAVPSVHHVSAMPHLSASTPTSGMSNVPPSAVQTHNQMASHNHPRSAPSTSPRSSTAGSSESGMQNGHNIPNYHENIYQGAMVAGPHAAYVIPSMGIPYAPSLPAYDATGLYTTCPGYAQPMAAYPYAVVLQPPREGGPAFAPSYGPGPLTYVPQPPTACYVRDTSGKTSAHLPIMNSYIY